MKRVLVVTCFQSENLSTTKITINFSRPNRSRIQLQLEQATVKRRRHDHPWYPNGEPLLAIPSGNLIRGCVRLFTSCVPVRQLAIIFTKWSTGLTLSAFFLAGTLRRLFITATSRVVKMRGLSPVNKLERELGGFNNVRWSGPRRDFWRKHIKSVHEENWNGRVCQKTSTSFAQLL